MNAKNRNKLSHVVAICFASGIMFGLTFGPSACHHEDNDHKTGWAVGYDPRECVCCGGLFVEYQSDTLLFPDIPDKIITWEQAYGFPLLISFDFEKIEQSCGFNWYKMTYVELLEHP